MVLLELSLYDGLGGRVKHKGGNSLKALLHNGANIVAEDLHLATPMHYSSESNFVEGIIALKESGVNAGVAIEDIINKADLEGHTPLHTASKEGNHESVQTLVSFGVVAAGCYI